MIDIRELSDNEVICETCEGEGTIDERLGGEVTSDPEAKCPDCDGEGYWVRADVRYERLKRKLQKRDNKIAGLERRVRELEHALADRMTDADRLGKRIENAVTTALCNVRMIPVFGGKHLPSKIVEVRGVDND